MRNCYRDPLSSIDFDALFCNTDDRIYVVGARGSGLRNLEYNGCDPMWSPDGSRLAFLARGSQLVVVASGLRPAKCIARDVYSYDWSPDGSRLVFERDNEIWVVGADGRGLRRLTRSGYARVAHGPR